MALINKISISCNGGTPTVFTIGLLDTNDAGINAVLATIPVGFGTYTYSHATVGTTVTSLLNANTANGCVATLYKDNIAYTANSACCAFINPIDLISTDAGNTITVGIDGKLYSNGTINGVPKTQLFEATLGQTIITLASLPSVNHHILVHRNGLRDLDFTVLGQTLTFTIPFGNSGNAVETEEVIVDYFEL